MGFFSSNRNTNKPKKFTVNFTYSRSLNKIITDSKGKPVYFTDQQPKSPENFLKLRAGGNKNAPVVADVSTDKQMKEFRLRVGNGLESFIQDESEGKNHKWVWSLPGPMGKKLVWKATKEVDIDPNSKKTRTLRSYKLVDEDAGKDVALFLPRVLYMKKEAEITISAEAYQLYGSQFEKALMASCLAIYLAWNRSGKSGVSWTEQGTSVGTESAIQFAAAALGG
ncbi:hypothetical protein ABW20_dc0102844 [Dactylellina cionopaga]|nr:hypothetical protein ABW20_dc0102844 [Dactylellina cionopaga]